MDTPTMTARGNATTGTPPVIDIGLYSYIIAMSKK